jgi:glycosyltransferase involved in cell wall biosynthesis
MLNDNRSPLLSVIVCSKNRPPELVESCLLHVQKSAGSSNIQIIIVDGNQTPVLQLVASKLGAKYIHETRKGMGIARQAGIRVATAKIIAFTDDDCEVNSYWVRKIIKRYVEDHELVILGGPDLTPKTSSFFQKSIGLLADLRGVPKKGPNLARRIINCNVAYVRKSLVNCGGYDETFETCEDQELNLRLFKIGHKFLFDPNLVIYHKRRRSLSGFWKQFFWYGYWQSKVFKKHPQLFARTAGILPPISIVAFLFTVTLALTVNLYTPLALMILAMITYGVIWILKIISICPDAWRSLPLALLGLYIRDTAMAFGFLAGMFFYYIVRTKPIC